jgi:hypothetical protein
MSACIHAGEQAHHCTVYNNSLINLTKMSESFTGATVLLYQLDKARNVIHNIILYITRCTIATIDLSQCSQMEKRQLALLSLKAQFALFIITSKFKQIENVRFASSFKNSSLQLNSDLITQSRFNYSLLTSLI